MYEDLLEKGIKLERDQKAILYVVKTLNELSDKGILKGKPIEITEKGLKEIKDFEPTNDEIQEAVKKMAVMGYFGG